MPVIVSVSILLFIAIAIFIWRKLRAARRAETIRTFSLPMGLYEKLRKRRPKARRYWVLNLIPPGGQIQNGDKTKAYVIGGLLGALAITNVTSFLVLRSWCNEVSGSSGSSVTCDKGGDHSSSAPALRVVNIGSGIGLILTYALGVYDGVKGYGRKESPQPYVDPVSANGGGGVVGVFGSF